MMDYQKSDLQPMYNTTCALNFYNTEERLDDGILSKIINLSVLNPFAIHPQLWSVIAAKSSSARQRLYRISGKQQIFLDSQAVLIILRDYSVDFQAGEPICMATPFFQPERLRRDTIQKLSADEDDAARSLLPLLSLSVMYAAKYYGVDSLTVHSIDYEAIKQTFHTDGLKEPVLVICLGRYDTSVPYTDLFKRREYSEAVMEV